MLFGYSDEAGHSSDSRVLAMGGIVGSHIDTEDFRAAWHAVLKNHGCTELHMSDLDAYQGEFKSWTDAQGKAFLADVMSCLDRFLFAYFGVAVVMEDYLGLPTILHKALVDPWCTCFQLSVSTMARTFLQRVGDPTPNDAIAILHDEQRQFKGRASEIFADLKRTASYRKRLGTCNPGSSSEIPELQVADLIAYETRKLFENALYDPSRPVRWTMNRLQEKHLSSWSYFDLGGNVPAIAGSPLTYFRKLHIVVSEDGLNVLEIPGGLGSDLT